MVGVVLRILVVSIASLGSAACSDRTLFQTPPRGGLAAPAPAPSDSTITLVASLPYDELVRVAETRIPGKVPVGGGGHIGCTDVPYVNPGHAGSHRECIGGGWSRLCATVPDFTAPSIGMRSQCADYHWNADVEKDGPLAVGRAGTEVHVAQKIHVAGKAGVGGDLARILSLSGKNMDVRVAAAMNVGIGLDGRWCPAVKAVPVGRWVGSASVEVIGRNCIGIDLGPLGHPEACAGPVDLGLADALNGAFDKHRDDIERIARDVLPCETMRSKVAERWHPFSIPINRPGQAPVFLNIQPRTAAFSGIIAEDKGVRLVARVGARTTVSPEDMSGPGGDLPELAPVSADRGSLSINLDAVAPYGFLKDELAASLKGRTFGHDTAAGKVEVRIEDVDLYPSDGSLAFGLKIDAKLPGRWFDTTGWVYLVGRPHPSADGRGMSVEDIGFATVLDNAFWNITQEVFETEILSMLKARADFDLGGQIDEAASQVGSSIAKANVPGLAITAGAPSIRITGVHVASDVLVATASLDLAFDATLTADLFR